MIPKTRALGAIVLLPVVVGILLFNLVQAPSGMIMALVIFALNLWIVFENKKRYAPMITG